MRSSVYYSLKTTVEESEKQWWVNMIVLVCLTRPGSFLLSFLLHSRWGGSEAYWWQKRRVLGSIKGLVNHGPKLQEVSIQWSLRQPSNDAIWALGWTGVQQREGGSRVNWVMTDLQHICFWGCWRVQLTCLNCSCVFLGYLLALQMFDSYQFVYCGHEQI